MIAVQGPNARAKAATLIGERADAALELKPFFGRELAPYFVARTGYTGEDGWEIMLPVAEAPAFWAALRAAGVAQCGLGARDTLRLEAGMNLYGNDMDENLSPLESGLTWTVAFDPPERDFVGRAALEAQRKRRRAAQARRPGARRSRRAAQPSESRRARRRRRRAHQRHVLADAGALDRLRARAGRDRRAGRRSTSAASCLPRAS